MVKRLRIETTGAAKLLYIREEGSTTIESIAKKKYLSEEVSRVGSDSERGGVCNLAIELCMKI